ncbi:pseudouridine synthase [Candidatus Xianfuyuplasma coldseepsis]|uniref:Pseudouridine synthase n=1 Tax=Candidatus Xianfuyuplasma coldseepsis TaxID=2782163 RepID=A0A7L7KRS5_9MOLU|nr:pseudouridine synthase [Xianfuyuplasma coldseepsis]QMS85521.1 rRNA pseudouridine synthase [Xianfuyuplasma coldseepsis]
MRLDRFVAMRKFGSRKDVSELIKKGLVSVNDQIITTPSKHIDETKDVVVVDGVVAPQEKTIVLMMNKPQGVVCANTDERHKTVLDLLEEPYSRYDLNIAGRLDIDTEGLVLLTNDGQLIHQLITPNKSVFKRYYVEVNQPFINPDILHSTYQIKDGKGELYQPQKAVVEVVDDTHFYLSIIEGKFHQIKRMVEHFGYQVTYLKRISIGDITLDDALDPGMYKEL